MLNDVREKKYQYVCSINELLKLFKPLNNIFLSNTYERRNSEQEEFRSFEMFSQTTKRRVTNKV